MEIQGRECIVAATAIFNGKPTEPLKQKPDRKSKNGLSQCLFFDTFQVPVGQVLHEVALRLNFTDYDKNKDPTLDAEIFVSGKKLPYDAAWQHKKKTANSSGQSVYFWAYEGCSVEFKVQYTNQQNQLGVAIIAAPGAAPDQSG